MEPAAWNFSTTQAANQYKLGHQFCPVCARPMHPSDILKQNDVIYIWYCCNQPECSGSYLEKFIRAETPV